MTIDFDDAYRRARPGHAFSNGTEWEMWAGNWCDRCTREAPFRNGITDAGCPLIAVAICAERIPSEWWETEPGSPDRYRCTEFRAPGGGSGQPRPRPDPPDMDGLFPRPERQVRMLAGDPYGEFTPAVVTAELVGDLL